MIDNPNPDAPDDRSPEPPTSRGRKHLEVPDVTRQEIVSLHEYYGTRQIAKRVGCSRKIVRRILREEGVTTHPTKRQATSKLAPFREQIEALVDKDLTVSRILREIRGDDPRTGYQGGRTILADFVRHLKEERGVKRLPRVKRRFETRPGEETQIDWSPYTLMIAGEPTPVRAFGALLGSSRKLYAAIFRRERVSDLLEALADAFDYFGGVTLRVVHDGMATAILGRLGPNGEPIWNPRFLDFARHYGFEPFPCRVRDPDRKGKKEKSFRLLWDDFLKGSEFDSWEDLKERLRLWLDHTPETANQRVHGTTRLVPNEAWLSERDFLIQLPETRFAVYRDEVRLVDQDSTLSIDGTRYTVPAELANRSVAVRLYAEHFEVVNRHERVVFSRRYVADKDKGKLQIDPTHYDSVGRRPRHAFAGRIDEHFLRRFPSLAPLVEGLKLRMKAIAHVHIHALLRLASRYGEEALLEAATHVQEHNRFDAYAVKRILERDHPLPEGDLPIFPQNGARAAVLLGEVDGGSIDNYSHFDTLEALEEEEEGGHGS